MCIPYLSCTSETLSVHSVQECLCENLDLAQEMATMVKNNDPESNSKVQTNDLQIYLVCFAFLVVIPT